eukprot:295383-Prorocentrum_minimum.AAC.4
MTDQSPACAGRRRWRCAARPRPRRSRWTCPRSPPACATRRKARARARGSQWSCPHPDAPKREWTRSAPAGPEPCRRGPSPRDRYGK